MNGLYFSKMYFKNCFQKKPNKTKLSWQVRSFEWAQLGISTNHCKGTPWEQVLYIFVYSLYIFIYFFVYFLYILYIFLYFLYIFVCHSLRTGLLYIWQKSVKIHEELNEIKIGGFQIFRPFLPSLINTLLPLQITGSKQLLGQGSKITMLAKYRAHLIFCVFKSKGV